MSGLDRGTEYNFRVAALTVNGTGPATDWLSAETFESDLDGKKGGSVFIQRVSTHRCVHVAPLSVTGARVLLLSQFTDC